MKTITLTSPLPDGSVSLLVYEISARTYARLVAQLGEPIREMVFTNEDAHRAVDFVDNATDMLIIDREIDP